MRETETERGQTHREPMLNSSMFHTGKKSELQITRKIPVK